MRVSLPTGKVVDLIGWGAALAALIGMGTLFTGPAIAADSVYNAPPANVIYKKPDSDHADTSGYSALSGHAYSADEAPQDGPVGRAGW